MGNFNLFLTHVLTFLHHVEQCCYPSFLSLPTFQAMTSHVANATLWYLTLITTQGLCNTTLLSFLFDWVIFFWAFRTIFLLMFTFHVHVALLTLVGIRRPSIHYQKDYLNLLLEGCQDLIANLRAHPCLNADPIALQWGVDTQVSSNDPMGIVHKNMANDLREIWRRPFPNTNCWNRKSLHSFRNRERLRTPYRICLQKAAQESLRLYDFVVVTLQLLRRGTTLSTLQAS